MTERGLHLPIYRVGCDDGIRGLNGPLLRAVGSNEILSGKSVGANTMARFFDVILLSAALFLTFGEEGGEDGRKKGRKEGRKEKRKEGRKED